MNYNELCNCEGCFKKADSKYRMMGVDFIVCKDHNIQLNTVHHNLTIETTISSALKYRDEILQYNSNQ